MVTATSITIEMSGSSRVLDSIEVSDEVTEYTTGDTFVKPTVTANYDNGSSKDVTNLATFDGYDMNQQGTYDVEVSYTEKEVTKTTSYEITVTDPAYVTGLTYSGNPSKKVYFAGDSFVSAGLTITAHFSDGTDEDVTDDTSWSPDPLTYGTTSVTGTFEGFEVVVSGLTVNKVELSSIVTSGQTEQLYVGDNTMYICDIRNHGKYNVFIAYEYISNCYGPMSIWSIA